MPFPIHPHMLRHACGFKLANDGQNAGLAATDAGRLAGSLLSLAIRSRALRPEHVAVAERAGRQFHDAVVDVAGGGKVGTTSAFPSISFALSPVRAASIALMAAIA
jgi:hypothetical protein